MMGSCMNREIAMYLRTGSSLVLALASLPPTRWPDAAALARRRSEPSAVGLAGLDRSAGDSRASDGRREADGVVGVVGIVVRSWARSKLRAKTKGLRSLSLGRTRARTMSWPRPISSVWPPKLSRRMAEGATKTSALAGWPKYT